MPPARQPITSFHLQICDDGDLPTKGEGVGAPGQTGSLVVTITPKKNVQFFTDNIFRKVSSGQICPRFLRTCLSSNIVKISTIQKADPFPSFSTEH